MIPNALAAGAIVLRKYGNRFDACRRLSSRSNGRRSGRAMPFLTAALSFLTSPVVLAVVALLAVAVLTALGLLHPLTLFGAAALSTGYSSSASTVTSMADLYEKTNTDVKIGTKLFTEEAKWIREYPREKITVSANENRVPVVLLKPTMPAMIPDGGHESVMQTPAATSGTFMPVQMNRRYGFTGLAQALDDRSKAAMIEQQVAYQANMVIFAFGRAIGLQTYGSSTGTVAVLSGTYTANANQTLTLTNAFGSSTFNPGTSATQKAWFSNVFVKDDHIATIRTGVLQEFAKVTAVPGAGGDGTIDVTFTSSQTPAAGDLVVFANADGDNTITGTDVNNWPIGFTDVLTASSVLGITTTNFSAWQRGSAATASQRLTFPVKEKMINECYNASGTTINRFIVDQSTRRDAIQNQRDLRRYNSSDVDLEGDLDAGDGEKVFTSQLAFPGTLLGWYDKAYGVVELSNQPQDGAGKSIFKLDKVQGVSQIAASYDYFYAKIPSARSAFGYATNLTGQ